MRSIKKSSLRLSKQDHSTVELLNERQAMRLAIFGIIQGFGEISNHPAVWRVVHKRRRHQGVLGGQKNAGSETEVRNVADHLTRGQLMLYGLEAFFLLSHLIRVFQGFVSFDLLTIKVKRGVERKRRNKAQADERSGGITGDFHGINGSFYTIRDVTMVLLADEGSWRSGACG